MDIRTRAVGFFLCLIPCWTGAADRAFLTLSAAGSARSCSSTLQNCSISITQRSSCLPQPGSITITNNSRVPARNIQASSTNANFNAFVIKNNQCPASLAPGASCTISFYTNTASSFSIPNVLVKGTNTNSTYFDLQAFMCSTVLQPDVSTLALSVNDSSLYPALTGNPRTITITNNGFAAADNVQIQASGFPVNTQISATTCSGSLAVGSSCTITISPGAAASSACTSGSTPTPGTVTVSATNAAAQQVGVLVLGYGCIYQGGYLFAIDDTRGCSTTPCTGSVGGKAVAPADAPSIMVWDSSTNCIMSANCFVTNADSPVDGIVNTNTIYNILTTVNGVSASTYGAGYCYESGVNSYTDWYLPAICEMGDTSMIPGIDCATTNRMQNIQANLASQGKGGFLNDVYLSSTEDAVNPTNSMWSQSLGLFPTQSTDNKNFPRNVRCVRSF